MSAGFATAVCWEPPSVTASSQDNGTMTTNEDSAMTDQTDDDPLDPSVDGVDRIEADWNRERPDIDVSSVGVITRIWRVGRHLERGRDEVLTEWSTDRAAIDILGMLRRAGPPYRRTAGDLTRHALITSGGVSQRLEKLERADLVRRLVDTADRRRVTVELTPTGVRLIDSVLSASMTKDSAILDGALDQEEQEHLRKLLRKLLLTLEPISQSGESSE